MHMPLQLNNNEEEEDQAVEELLSTLPKEKIWNGRLDVFLYQGFWFPEKALKCIVPFRSMFHATDDDIVLASFPKSGTTWTKALVYSIVNRGRFPGIAASPLQHTSPMQLVPTVDTFFKDRFNYFMDEDDESITSRPPRIVATHTSFSILPDSVKTKPGACKIVYVWRNPMDQFISMWHFSQRYGHQDDDGSQHLPLEECFDLFCNGVCPFGPYWDHVLGYWKASQAEPNRILILKYEDLKEDTTLWVKKMSDFLGCPFSAREEEQGIVDQIVSFCSFDSMKNSEANRTNAPGSVFPASAYFRKGVVGDSANYFTPSMVDRVVKITREKWAGSGLSSVHPQIENLLYP